ncbi:MAG: 3-deoxy-D-manno-octulosonic acid transferase [Lysobacterales bacterium]|nr:MAG: 3-deoxy-D-manno-octulosonic acid transferase [Xanthomonadales bacterium]
MRRLYSLLLYLATPLVLLYLFLRGLRNPDYLARWSERFARFAAPAQSGGIAVHAVSLGEVNAAGALVRELARRYPDHPLCLTTVTPAGSARVRALFGAGVFHVYAPLDLPGAVRRFFERVQPRLLIVMETEIWPNLYHEAAARGIPILIANARISQRSIGGYRRLRKWTAEVLGQVSRIAAQTALDAGRLVEIGADPARVTISGNLKFDVRLPPGQAEAGQAIRRSWGAQRPVLLAGSTHEGDELPLLEAFPRLLETWPDALLVLAPRRPERFGRAAQLARNAGLSVSLRSAGIVVPPGIQCLVIDSTGELQTFYAACDVAFVGGSLEPHGGHNVLEASALSRPVLVGPHTFNFEEITRQLVAAGAALRVSDAGELHTALLRLFGDAELRDRMGQAGLGLVRSGQGALDRTLALVGELLTAAAVTPAAD